MQGRVVWQNKDLDDLVLLRSDGNPTYMLAVVVDDHDMGVTHIIRGDDHLTNAARQKQIYDALGWATPAMAHIPLIHGADGAKLSKRHGALAIDAYRTMGYLPAALRNYLVRLGWSHGDQEIFSTEEMIAAFDLQQIGRSPARFDFAKLENLNGHYIRQMPDEALVDALETILPELGPPRGLGERFPADLRQKLIAAMPGLKERAKTLVELLDNASFLYASRPLPLDPKASDILGNGGRERVAGALAGARAAAAMGRAQHGGGGALLRGGCRRQARAGRPAAARGPDRQVDLARAVRRDGGPRPRRDPGAPARSGDRARRLICPEADRPALDNLC